MVIKISNNIYALIIFEIFKITKNTLFKSHEDIQNYFCHQLANRRILHDTTCRIFNMVVCLLSSSPQKRDSSNLHLHVLRDIMSLLSFQFFVIVKKVFNDVSSHVISFKSLPLLRKSREFIYDFFYFWVEEVAPFQYFTWCRHKRYKNSNGSSTFYFSEKIYTISTINITYNIFLH